MTTEATGREAPSTRRETFAATADLVRVVALLSAAVVLIDGQVEATVRFVLIFLVLLVPRQLRVAWPLDAAFGAGLVVAAWASAQQWYSDAWWVDVVIHFFVPALTASMVYLVLSKLDLLPPLRRGVLRRHRASVIVLVVAFGLAVGALWELYEWSAVNVLSNESIHVGYEDTILDLTMGGLGSGLAGLMLSWWARREPRPGAGLGRHSAATRDEPGSQR